jgi:hypothetical protein
MLLRGISFFYGLLLAVSGESPRRNDPDSFAPPSAERKPCLRPTCARATDWLTLAGRHPGCF